ncbi:MAG: hypothetical protein M1819_004615 [Sarea resinae]|nr:MAG: hypothetical protein M1819_004615 [Sarea resinae]
MPLKGILRKKEQIVDEDVKEHANPPAPPGFTFMRTTTNTQEIIEPPSFPSRGNTGITPPEEGQQHLKLKRRPSLFRRASSATTQAPKRSPSAVSTSDKPKRSVSQRLHLKTRRHTTIATSHALLDLPTIDATAETEEEKEAKWEQRATLLARGNANDRPGSSHSFSDVVDESTIGLAVSEPRSRRGSVSDAAGDDHIQEAIRLHESGDLERSTAMFGRLADPEGANNALSQVLYGLALRHGWGCPADPSKAITYFTYAASNSADVEAQALSSGLKRGGSAKGELVLAIFELGNCFRHGWGVEKDPPAAKQYYETAANLGDTDAMNEVAWCYVNGFGVKKDKVSTSL